MSRTVVITMAGRGSRFKQVGIETPKYLIEIDGRTMFEYALKSLADLVDDRFVFVTRADHGVDDVIAEHCERAGIDNHETVSVQSVTEGQASTAIVADGLVPDNNTVGIYNIDTYIEVGQLLREELGTGHCIPVFRPSGDQWSFVERDTSGAVRRVIEKERVSELASVGYYQFSSWRRFRSAYEGAANTVKAEYGETYVAPLYNWLVDAGDNIDILEVDSDAVHVLGTPEELTDFYPGFPH